MTAEAETLARPEDVPRQAVLLFVDDEPNILSSLRRLFRPLGYRILTAESGAAGLELLGKEHVDLVVSDMRMPAMDGAHFLEQVRQQWPGVTRILLTGYSDINSTVNAINRGEIYRYIAKPWDDQDITLIVREALERRRLESENQRLLDLTQHQNEELKSLNQGLEARVAERTAELSQTMSFVEMANQQLKRTLLTTVRVVSGLGEMRGGLAAGHSRRVAEHARAIATRMDLNESQIHEIVMAALLHDIGKLAIPDRIMEKPFNALSQEDRAVVMKHPAQGAMALMEIEQLRGAAQLIRHHHEYFDGTGFPDRLAGMSIPLGARILVVANEFDALQMGMLFNRRLAPMDAWTFVKDNKGKRYDPEVVAAFDQILAQTLKQEKPKEIALPLVKLRPGMVLSQDLFNHDGYLLLAKGFALTAQIVDELLKVEHSAGKAAGQALRAFVTTESAGK
ncbi:MAG: response regulator [Rhodocyclaceae bacterium]|nr:response regulator [Rhodocyclaceae bacterium]